MNKAIVVFNSSSTSLKFGAYGVDALVGPEAALPMLREGHIDSMQSDPHFVVKDSAGHRAVLGGARFETPVLVDGGVLDYLDSLVETEPSHQPFNVAGARAFAQAFPGLPQVACFDTSFHRTMPEVAQTYALPAGALFYLLRSKRFDDATLEKMLYERCGLLGLSGISGDMRVLLDNADPRAVAARTLRRCARRCVASWAP